jgi:hypothetical protein
MEFITYQESLVPVYNWNCNVVGYPIGTGYKKSCWNLGGPSSKTKYISRWFNILQCYTNDRIRRVIHYRRKERPIAYSLDKASELAVILMKYMPDMLTPTESLMPGIEINSIIDKIHNYLDLKDEWNGPNTKSPNRISSLFALDIVKAYNNFLRRHSIASANIQIYPLNRGGIALELMTLNWDLILEIGNEVQRTGSDKLVFFLTNDQDFEKEGTVNIQELDDLLLKLHNQA